MTSPVEPTRPASEATLTIRPRPLRASAITEADDSAVAGAAAAFTDCVLMGDLLDHTETLLRNEIARWPDGTVSFTDYLDSDGIDVCDVPITVDLTVRGDELVALQARRTPEAPLTAVSMGNVISVSTSSGASPGASVMMTTRGRFRFGKTSISI